MQLRNSNEHAGKSKCVLPGGIGAICNLLHLAPAESEFNQNENHSYRIVSFKEFNLTFYFLASYLASKKCFIYSVMLPANLETASKYNVRFTVVHGQRSLIFEGAVLSIEDLQNIEDRKANMKYWFVSHETMEPFFTMNRDRVSDFIRMEVLKNEKKRKRI